MIEGLKIHGPVVTLSGQARNVTMSRKSVLADPSGMIVTGFTIDRRQVEFWQSMMSWPLLELSEGDRVTLAGGSIDDLVLVDYLRLTGSRKIWGGSASVLAIPGLLLLFVSVWAFAHGLSLSGVLLLLAAAWLFFRAERQMRARWSVRPPRRDDAIPLDR